MTPFQAVALKDLSLIPPVSVTWQALNAGAGGSVASGSAGASVATSSTGASVTTGSSVGASVGVPQAASSIAATIRTVNNTYIFLNIETLLLK